MSRTKRQRQQATKWSRVSNSFHPWVPTVFEAACGLAIPLYKLNCAKNQSQRIGYLYARESRATRIVSENV